MAFSNISLKFQYESPCRFPFIDYTKCRSINDNQIKKYFHLTIKLLIAFFKYKIKYKIRQILLFLKIYKVVKKVYILKITSTDKYNNIQKQKIEMTNAYNMQIACCGYE